MFQFNNENTPTLTIGGIFVPLTINPAVGGASQHNSMPVPSPDKWRGKPENPA